MLATTHILAGAGTGEVIGNPYLSFVAAIIIHFLIDKIPHFWPKRFRDKVLLNVIDWTVAFAIFFIFAASSTPNKAAVLAGAFGGIVVDIVLDGLPFIYKRKLGTWHVNRQPHETKPVFITTDLLFIVPLIIYFSTRD